MRAEVLRELTRPRSAADRLRARTSAAAAAGVGVVLLAVASVAGLGGADFGSSGDYSTTATTGRTAVSAVHDLAPFVAQAGLRPGIVLGLALLTLPLLALGVQALRVGSLALDRQASLLALAGATRGDLRRVRVARTAAAFGRGGLVAAPMYALLWLAAGVLPHAGNRLLPVPQVWLPLAWLVIIAALTGCGAALGAVSGPGRAAVVPGATLPRRPPPLALGAGTAVAAIALVLATFRTRTEALTMASLFVVVVLLMVTAWVVVSRRDARRARTPRRSRAPHIGDRGDRAVAILAAAQRRGDPRAAGVVAGVFLVCGVSFGVEAMFVVNVWRSHGLAEDASFYVGGAALAGLVGAVAAVVALASLGLSLTDHLLGARRSVAATAALGTEHRRMVTVQAAVMRSATVPAVVAGILVPGVLYGVLAGLSDAGVAVRALATIIATALVAALLVALGCRVVAQLLSRRVRAAADLDHLRVP